LLVDLTDWSRS